MDKVLFYLNLRHFIWYNSSQQSEELLLLSVVSYLFIQVFLWKLYFSDFFPLNCFYFCCCTYNVCPSASFLRPPDLHTYNCDIFKSTVYTETVLKLEFLNFSPSSVAKLMIESSLTEMPSPLRTVSHLYLIVDPYTPMCVLGVRTCQCAPWLGQWCPGLSGLTNCLVYVILSATGINVAWLDCGQSVCNPIIFSKPRPFEPPCCSADMKIPCVLLLRHWRLPWSVKSQWGPQCLTEQPGLCVWTTISSGITMIGDWNWKHQ